MKFRQLREFENPLDFISALNEDDRALDQLCGQMIALYRRSEDITESPAWWPTADGDIFTAPVRYIEKTGAKKEDADEEWLSQLRVLSFNIFADGREVSDVRRFQMKRAGGGMVWIIAALLSPVAPDKAA